MKSLLLLVLASFLTMQLFSQEISVAPDSTQQKQEEPAKEKKQKEPYTGKRTFVGGGLGMSFSNNSGFFNGSVMLGYNFTKRLQVAGKFTYWYNWGKAITPNNQGSEKYDGSIYALSLPIRFVIWKGIFLHAEPEYMNLPQYVWNFDGSNSSGYTLDDYRIDAFNFYVGGGAYLHFKGNSGPFFQVLWNLNETDNSFYSNPYWQVGYAFGL